MGNFGSVFYRSEEALRVIEQVCSNDPSCTVVEIKPEHYLTKSDFERLFVGLRRNSHVEEVILAGLGLNDDDGFKLITALNTSHIVRLNLDHNNFCGLVISRIIRAVTRRGVLRDLQIRHQRNWDCNSRTMEEIKENLDRNKTLQFLGMEIPIQDPDAIRLIFRQRDGQRPHELPPTTEGEGSDLGMTRN